MDEHLMPAAERAAFANGHDAGQQYVADNLRRDVRELIDGMRIMLVKMQWLEQTVAAQQTHLSTLHQWMNGMSERVRNLEHGD